MKFFDISNVKDTAIGTAHKALFKVEKDSPKILLVTGTIAMVGSLIWMHHAAIQADSEMKQAKDDIRVIHKESQKDEKGRPVYTPEQKEVLKESYKDILVSGIRIYSGPVILGVVSIGSFLAGQGILDDRLVKTGAALSSAMEANRATAERAKKYLSEADYRRVINGEVLDERVIETTDPETGEQKQEVVSSWKPAYDDPKVLYTRYWNSDCMGWLRTGPDYNIMHLKGILQECQRILERDGVLWLSTVLELLEMPVTKASRIVGWKFNPNVTHQVSFGPDFEAAIGDKDRSFWKNWGQPGNSIRLEFNVDNDSIWQELPEV